MKILVPLLFTLLATAQGEDVYEDYEESGDSEVMTFHDILQMAKDNPGMVSFMNPVISVLSSILAPTSDKVQNELCRNHSEIYLQALRNGSPWAIRMFDASSKLPGGVAEGNYGQMGTFDECVKVQVALEENSGVAERHFVGQHCGAFIGFEPKGEMPSMIREVVGDRHLNLLVETSPFGMIDEFRFRSKASSKARGFPLIISLCIPSSCKAEDLQISLEDSLQQVASEMGFNASVVVHPENCQTNQPLVLDAGDWAMIAVIGVFVLLTLAGTTYECILRRKENSPASGNFLLDFSAYKNTECLLSVKSGEGVFGCLDGLRFLSICWVILGHRNLFDVLLPIDNFLDYYKRHQSWHRPALTNASLSVDVFLLLSGFLLTYLFLKKMNGGARFKIFQFYILRYIRLTPPFAILIGVLATVFIHLGSGPMWNYILSSVREDCRSQWWVNLLYLNNYVKTDTMCLEYTWYLALDTQLYWISPLILMPLLKWPKFGLVQLVLLILFTSGYTFWITLKESLPWTTMLGKVDNTKNFLKHVYIVPHARAGAYFVGMLLGYLVFKLRGRKTRLSKLTVILGWITSTSLGLTVVYAVWKVNQVDFQYDSLEAAFYSSCHRVVFALCVAWVIFACIHGYAGPVDAFLSWKLFHPLAKLSYTAFLLQIFVLYADVLSLRSARHQTDFGTTHSFLGDVFMTFLLAYGTYILFEAPFLNLIRTLIEKEVKKQADEKATAEVKVDAIVITGNGNHTENKNHIVNGKRIA